LEVTGGFISRAAPVRVRGLTRSRFNARDQMRVHEPVSLNTKRLIRRRFGPGPVDGREKNIASTEFEVKSPLTTEDVEQLREVIEAADDEKPIQEFIESHPQILGTLLGGNIRFCLPRSSLAGKYVPDFLASNVDSLGVRWVLIELETPRSSVTLKNSNELEQHARKGVSQVREWREWLQKILTSPGDRDGMTVWDL